MISTRTVPSKGRAAFANCALKARQTLHTEVPLVSLQLPESEGRCEVCTRCLAFVGPLNRHLHALTVPPPVPEVEPFLAELLTRPVPLLADEDQFDVVVACPSCSRPFCSDACLNDDEVHKLLCPVWGAGSEAWSAFCEYGATHCETLLFAARCAALQIHRWISSSGTSGADLFEAYTHPAWWDVVPVPPGAEPSAFRDSLVQDASMGLKLFQAVLLDHPSGAPVQDAASRFCTLDAWGSLMGLLTQNALAVHVSNPVAAYLLEVCGLLPNPAAVRAVTTLEVPLRAIVAHHRRREEADDDDEEGEDGDADGVNPAVAASGGTGTGAGHLARHFLQAAAGLKGRKLVKAAAEGVVHASGSALFPLLSCFNHSCAPNCSVHFFANNRVVVVADRAISAGEELTISYVDTEEDKASRAEELAEYGFVCDCPRCTAEKS